MVPMLIDFDQVFQPKQFVMAPQSGLSFLLSVADVSHIQGIPHGSVTLTQLFGQDTFLCG